MKTEHELKEIVREKYAEIARQSKETNQSSCCGSTGCCTPVDFVVMAEDYTHLPGYVADADLGLGCGLPTEFAQIRPGDTVVDLGSGAGNDAFVARSIAGASGHVIGIDMTDAMINKARANAAKLNFSNVEFRFGDIEQIPVDSNTVDVVVSNCVMNLVPNKQQAFGETYRILKPGGHFSISDVVLKGALPEVVRQSAELYAGCVSGAQQMNDYLRTISDAGFVNVTVQKEREISIPNEIMLKYMTLDELRQFKRSGTGIYSVTVYADKP
ncbi:MAG: arsenite methyltransferase [Bacteroidota bacterium]